MTGLSLIHICAEKGRLTPTNLDDGKAHGPLNLTPIDVVIMCITIHVTSTIEQWHLQPSEAIIGHRPAGSVGSC